MKALYIVSTESFSGKTSLCYGIATRMKRDGLRVGYFKPLVFYGTRIEGHVVSEDAPFMRTALDLKEGDDLLAPVVLDPLAIENAAIGKLANYGERIDRAFAQVSKDKDVVVIEGAATLLEGMLLGLAPQHIAERLDAQVIAVARFVNELALDGLIAAQREFDKRLLGVVINEVPRHRLDFVDDKVKNALEARGIYVFATLPQERLLLSMTVGEIAKVLDAEMVGAPERDEELVENLMVGAMSMDSALAYFRRKPNKAVITGGDRADIQLAALETSTRCLVLTGNLRPSPLIQGRADELGVPIIIAKQDTLTTVEIIQQYFGKLRLHQPRKVERVQELLDERFRYTRLYRELGLHSGE